MSLDKKKSTWQAGVGLVWPLYLFVLEAEEQDLLHHGQLGLFASLCALAKISRVKGNLVAILAVFVARLGAGILDVGGRVGSGRGIAGLAFGAAQTASSSAAAPCQARSGHFDTDGNENAGGKRIAGRDEGNSDDK